MVKYFLGVDIGTSGCKSILIDELAHVMSSATVEYSLNFSHEGTWAEIDPEAWYDAAIRAIGSCMKKASVKKEEIMGVGLSGQMVSLLGLDKEGKAVRPVIMWLDKRNIQEAEELKLLYGEMISKITCNPVNQQFTLPKLLWLKYNEPANYQRIHKIVLSKDYIRYRLTGEYATDCNDATGTLMHDIRRNEWSKDILGRLGIDERILPDIFYSTEVTGRITKKAAQDTGLCEGTPVVAGSGDLGCENFACGVFERGNCMMRLGSGAAITIPVSEPMLDPNLKGPCSGYYKKDIWLIQGMTQAFGSVMRWVRDSFSNGVGRDLKQDDTFYALDKKAQDAPIGSDGLVFVPFINAAPYWKEYMQGGYIGVSPAHKLGHFVRAAMEGAACALKDAVTDLEKFGNTTIKECVVTGGGSKSSLWTQMIADLIDKELIIMPYADACTGAALMAAIGMGIDKEAIIKALWSGGNIRHVKPGMGKSMNIAMYEKYAKVYGLMDDFYLNLKNPG